MAGLMFKIDFKNQQGSTQTIAFRLIRCNHHKTDFGGYSDTVRNVTLLHAYSQTDQTIVEKPKMFEQETQIFDTATKFINPIREFGAQTNSPGELFIDPRTDRLLTPNKYFDSELWLLRRIEAAVYIQKMTRAYLARRRINKIKELSRLKSIEQKALKDAKETAAERQKQSQIARKINPTVT